jgi:hypothetical protein
MVGIWLEYGWNMVGIWFDMVEDRQTKHMRPILTTNFILDRLRLRYAEIRGLLRNNTYQLSITSK